MSNVVASIKTGIKSSSLSKIIKALIDSYGPDIRMQQSGEILEFFLDDPKRES